MLIQVIVYENIDISGYNGIDPRENGGELNRAVLHPGHDLHYDAARQDWRQLGLLGGRAAGGSL